MNIRRIWNTAVLTSAAAALWTLAQGCGPSIGSFCNKVCDCMGCSDSERDDCVDSLEDAKKDAEDEGCGSEFNDYLSCSSSEMECQDDVPTSDGCDSEAEELAKCSNGGVAIGGSIAGYCQKVCDCTGCASSELQDCVDGGEEAKQQAEDAGCATEFDAFVSCVNTKMTCENGNPSIEACNGETNDYINCISG